MEIIRVSKRDGTVVSFEHGKISDAIFKAAVTVGGRNRKEADYLADKVVDELLKGEKEVPNVEEVQDAVEKVLIEGGHAKTAKAYIVYRQKRAELREEKKRVLEKAEIDEVDKRFDVNALRVLKARYLRRNSKGKLIETPKELFTRVAVHAALPDLFYDSRIFDIKGTQAVNPVEDFTPAEHEDKYAVGKYALNQYHWEAMKRMYDRFNRNKQMGITWTQLFSMVANGDFNSYEKNISEFFDIMTHKEFLPNTPAIANFGNPLGMGSACFVLDVPDSIDGIMETLKNTAIVFKAGGGMGYNFSKLRPEGDFVSSTGGVASGPLSFMRLFDTMTEVIKQGGIRRGANMGILNSNHPDIEKFITAKDGNKTLRNFNISVLLMPEFWECYEKNEPYPLVNPRTKEIVKYIDPKVLFDKMVYQAWESAEPGVIFYDVVNKYNPFFEHLGPIVTTNPCVDNDTLVPTENGLERIDSMKTKSIFIDGRTGIQSGNLMLLQKGCRKAEAAQVIKTGIKDTFKLTTKSGYELIATADHKVFTDNGWKEIDKLTKDDSVFLQSGHGSFNIAKELSFNVNNTIIGENGRTYSLNLPKEWSRELGLVLGWLTGDGWFNENNNSMGFVFAPEDNEIKDAIKPILEGYFNREIKERTYENGCVQIRSASKYIIDFFKKLGVMQDRCVPQSVFTATEEAVIGFLQGIFSADGTIGMGSESRNYIRLNSSSIRLLKDVQLILLNIGIRSSIYDRTTKPKEFKYTNSKGELVIYTTSGENYELNISKENVPKFLEKIGFLHSKFKEKALKISKFGFYEERFLDKVKGIEYAGKREVYDITEPLSHSFIANGIVVHNCGEVLLYPNEPCNLGSINVWAFVKHEDDRPVMDWDGLKEAVITSTKLLDNVIDVNNFPLKAIEEMSLNTRKIGLGVMGVGDLLYELRIPYNTEEGRRFMEKLMEFITYWSKIESIELAKKRGNLPYYNKSFYKDGQLPFRGRELRDEWHFDWDKMSQDIKQFGIRNGYTTIIAPTGSISMIAGCSSGMEPVYSLAFEKNVKVGSFYYVDPAFEKVMREEGLYNDELMSEICNNKGSMQGLGSVPEHLRNVFMTALDITPEDHIRALASFQKWVDSSISKTNNFPADATLEYMRDSYILAYRLGCKDVTVFRDTSIKDQVLVAPTKKEEKVETKLAEMKHEAKKPKESETGLLFANGNGEGIGRDKTIKNCPECSTLLEKKEGCVNCPSCGWGMCT
ncbi:intein-containing adenosylcobalamin-dependent ribonucleoside-diphosphate reductase [Candidatus Woesearchaeota archaeon]|nr:intein-containing adenosylcobalamin-dependent ribonucleoside-diphosphate reductase [Candidatus Woesearchaeota archaeon]